MRNDTLTRQERISRGISHCCPTCGGPLTFKELRVDLATNTLFGDGVACKVPPRHAEIAHMLVEKFPGPVTTGALLLGIWGDADVSTSLLNTTLCYTRRTLEKVGYGIKSEFGVGFRLVRL